MINAVFTHNNAHDSILVANNSNPAFIQCTPKTIQEFIRGDSFDNWDSPNFWDEYNSDILLAADNYGETVAYWQDGTLVILNEKHWDERLEFYGLLEE